MNNYLTQASLFRLIGVMFVVLLPHFWNVPLWEAVFIPAVLGWRCLAALRQWELPKPRLRALLTVLATVGVYGSYGNLSGQDPGTALLALMCAFKLLEMRSRRDVMVVVFLMYFVLMTHFLISQEMWAVAYMLICTVGITAFLMEASHASVGTPVPLPIPLTLRMGTIMVACALPLMLLLFVLFPRIPGPLWGLPSDSGAERSGLPDSMSPGDIADLILSDEPAFRVQFEGAAPPQRDLYWRGPVFDHFDGRKWKISERDDRETLPKAEYSGEPLAYEITLEPVRTQWLMALDLPNPKDAPQNAYVNADHHLVSRQLVRDRKLYRTSSYPQYALEPQLTPAQRQRNLALPRFGNSGAHTLANNWRAEGLGDAQIVQRALQLFRQEQFFYTLKPPKLGQNSIDEFLFETRRGFCEHYSSAFTFLMRAAGIPARVVIGYQGGYKNQFGDYYIVSHSDAHAWSEVWLPERGWVRMDPTSAVAPNRIEQGLNEAAGLSGELPEFLRRSGSVWATFNARLDWINNQWNYWVLAYGPELQESFLKQFGITDWSGMVLALTFIGTLTLAIIGALLLRQYRTADTADMALKLWRRAQSALAKRGLIQRPSEGPRDFARRVEQEEPALAQPIHGLASSYMLARYTGAGNAEDLKQLEAAVQQMETGKPLQA